MLGEENGFKEKIEKKPETVCIVYPFEKFCLKGGKQNVTPGR